MKKGALYMVILMCCLLAGGVSAQRISFGLYAQDGIMLAPGSVPELDFNDKQASIFGGSSVTIGLQDNFAAVITITGRADLDVTVSLDMPAALLLDASNQIPLSLSMAYCNQDVSSEALAKAQAIQVPAGFTSITFPMVQRTAGPPGPPPTPNLEGTTLPTAVAYLFIYGTLGPVPMGSAAGIYDGEINIHVEYSTYNQ